MNKVEYNLNVITRSVSLLCQRRNGCDFELLQLCKLRWNERFIVEILKSFNCNDSDNHNVFEAFVCSEVRVESTAAEATVVNQLVTSE